MRHHRKSHALRRRYGHGHGPQDCVLVLDFNGDRKFYTGTLAGARPGWSRAYPDAVALTEAQAAKLAGRFHAGFLLPPGTHDGHTIDVVRDYGLATEARL